MKYDICTMNQLDLALMEGKSIVTDHCVVCGAHGHLEQHHIVRRSAGQVVRAGIMLEKPTLTLCGRGNTSGCHGLTHQLRLHFRWHNGAWQYLKTQEPTKYQDALAMDGWQYLKG